MIADTGIMVKLYVRLVRSGEVTTSGKESALVMSTGTVDSLKIIAVNSNDYMAIAHIIVATFLETEAFSTSYVYYPRSGNLERRSWYRMCSKYLPEAAVDETMRILGTPGLKTTSEATIYDKNETRMILGIEKISDIFRNYMLVSPTDWDRHIYNFFNLVRGQLNNVGLYL